LMGHVTYTLACRSQLTYQGRRSLLRSASRAMMQIAKGHIEQSVNHWAIPVVQISEAIADTRRSFYFGLQLGEKEEQV
jgi:hypothetical protein